MRTPCPQCHKQQLTIQQAPDSHNKRAQCAFCGWWCWLKNFNKQSNNMKDKTIKKRLDYLRQEIQAERISTAEIAELESLKDHIDSSDTLLLEWAGVPEFED